MKSWLKDIVWILIAGVIWWITPLFTRWIDPTAGVDDAGFIQRISFALVALFCFHAFTKIFMKILFPVLDEYLAKSFSSDFLKYKEEICPKHWLSVSVYCSIMIVLALMF